MKNGCLNSSKRTTIQNPTIGLCGGEAILQQDSPDDYVCATGSSYSVRDLCEYVFTKLGMNYTDYVTVDERYFRAEELVDLKGDSTKLRTLGWEPKYNFVSLLDDMIEYWSKKL